MERLSSKQYSNEFVSHFEGDETGDLRPRPTPKVFYSKAIPTPVSEPKLLAWSTELGEQLGIEYPNDKDVAVLGGNLVTPTMHPYAACYAGHQFGNWAGQLGDGRAITLGEWQAPNGSLWELQLKGAGPTPYSRRADGRAVLRSSVREYLMSEAMHYLGVPTTRALSLVSTGDPVLRDMFYNGNAAYEPGAIVMRVAPSFLRFGNFEILAARGEIDNLKKLVDWTIEKHYPHLEGDDKVILWFREVVERTARLMSEWMRVGFVHGVMNTDNMSILGLTIDYGPYSFVDDYDPSFTPNTTDLPGRRYAFGRQPSVAKWNLSCLAGALAPLFSDTELLQTELNKYDDAISEHYYTMMGQKLGLGTLRQEDSELIASVEKMLATLKPDMTLFYQYLIDMPLDFDSKEAIINHFNEAFYQDLNEKQSEQFYNWMKVYQKRIQENGGRNTDTEEGMRKANPRFILRNYLLHQAIEALEKGDSQLFLELQEAIKTPYSKDADQFFKKRPDWATQKAGCSMLSCSS